MAVEQGRSIEPWRALTRQLVTSGLRRGESLQDAEDRAQDALVRLVRDDPERTQRAVPSAAFAHQALKLARVDELRRDTRISEVPSRLRVVLDDPTSAIAEPPTDADEISRRIEFMEIVDALCGIFRPEEVEMLMKQVAGWTEEQIAAALPPGSPTTGALRKRVRRAIPALAERLNIPRRF